MVIGNEEHMRFEGCQRRGAVVPQNHGLQRRGAHAGRRGRGNASRGEHMLRSGGDIVRHVLHRRPNGLLGAADEDVRFHRIAIHRHGAGWCRVILAVIVAAPMWIALRSVQGGRIHDDAAADSPQAGVRQHGDPIT